MNIIEQPILSLIVFLPVLGGLILLALSDQRRGLIKVCALIICVLDFLLFLSVYLGFDPTDPGMQFIEKRLWIDQFGITYFLGIDGISLLLVGLTVFLTPLAILASWNSVKQRVKGFLFFILALETGMIGVFVALDMFLFYLFWEAMLVPMYFLIGIWGHERRIYAAVKFFLFTLLGSVLMLVAILVLVFLNYHQTGLMSFDLIELYNVIIPGQIQFWLMLAFFLAFAIKVPLFPLHTWLPDAHVEAPTAGSVILAGVLLKMGTYGMLRFALPLFPEASIAFVPVVATLAIIGIIYGALVAFAQKDLKKLVAYSSVSHLGFVVLGIYALNHEGIQGSILQMINHGLTTGALFMMVGMLYERRHTRLIADFGGLAKSVPRLAAFFLIFVLASLGLPGLNNFVGEFLILLGVFKVNKFYAVLAATGVILAAVYLLSMYRRVMFGSIEHEENRRLKDLSLRESLVLGFILIFVVWIGIHPNTFLSKMEASVSKLIVQVEGVQRFGRN